MMTTALSDIIDFSACPVSNPLFACQCAARLASDSILTIPGFLLSGAVDMLVAEAEAQCNAAEAAGEPPRAKRCPFDQSNG